MTNQMNRFACRHCGQELNQHDRKCYWMDCKLAGVAQVPLHPVEDALAPVAPTKAEPTKPEPAGRASYDSEGRRITSYDGMPREPVGFVYYDIDTGGLSIVLRKGFKLAPASLVPEPEPEEPSSQYLARLIDAALKTTNTEAQFRTVITRMVNARRVDRQMGERSGAWVDEMLSRMTGNNISGHWNNYDHGRK